MITPKINRNVASGIPYRVSGILWKIALILFIYSVNKCNCTFAQSSIVYEEVVAEKLEKEKLFLENFDVLRFSSYTEDVMWEYFSVGRLAWNSNKYRDNDDLVEQGDSRGVGGTVSIGDDLHIYAHYLDKEHDFENSSRMKLVRISYSNLSGNENFNIKVVLKVFGWPKSIFRKNSLIEEKFDSEDKVYSKILNRTVLFEMRNNYSYVNCYMTIEQSGVVSRQNFEFRSKDNG